MEITLNFIRRHTGGKMLTEQEVEEMLRGAVRNCITIGKAYMKMYPSTGRPLTMPHWNLKELYSWGEVETLCEVLELDPCPVWNEIVTECPNMGKITECAEDRTE